MKDRRLSQITPEELAAAMHDAETWVGGEPVNTYGWYNDGEWTRGDTWKPEAIEAAALAIRALMGEDCIPDHFTMRDMAKQDKDGD